MLKRVACLIFVLAIAGQAFAGVCGCFAIEGKHHSCCKPAKVTADAIRPHGCCDTECLKRASERTSQTRTAAAAETTLDLTPAATPALAWSFEPVATASRVKEPPVANHR